MILAFLSQSEIQSVDPAFLSNFTLALLSLLGVVVAVVTIWSLTRLRPPHETPTRREFDNLTGKVDHLEGRLAPMEQRILATIEKSSTRIQKEIHDVASADHEGQIAIWERINTERRDLGERVKALEIQIENRKS